MGKMGIYHSLWVSDDFASDQHDIASMLLTQILFFALKGTINDHFCKA